MFGRQFAALLAAPSALTVSQVLAGSVAIWYDLTDRSTLFQDSAGTNPVTDYLQGIGQMRDKSGNGLHALQATNNSRPQYRVGASGSPAANADGVTGNGSTMSVNLQGKFAGVNKFSVSVAIWKKDDSSRHTVLNMGSNTNSGGWAVFAPTNGGKNAAIRLQNQVGGGFSDNPTSNFLAPTVMVFSANIDLTRTEQTEVVRMWINGVYNTSASNTGNMTQIDPANNTMVLFDGQGRFNGEMVGLIIRANHLFTDTERQVVESHLRSTSTYY